MQNAFPPFNLAKLQSKEAHSEYHTEACDSGLPPCQELTRLRIPTAHYHTEIEGRYYIVLSSLSEETLADKWLGADEAT